VGGPPQRWGPRGWAAIPNQAGQSDFRGPAPFVALLTELPRIRTKKTKLGKIGVIANVDSHLNMSCVCWRKEGTVS